MIYFISIEDKLEKELVKKTIKEFDKNGKQIEDESSIKKVDIIICDNNKHKIDHLSNYKKKMIIYIKKGKTPEELLKNNKISTYSRRNELGEILCFILSKEKRKNIGIFCILLSIGVFVVACMIYKTMMIGHDKHEKSNNEKAILEERKKEKVMKEKITQEEQEELINNTIDSEEKMKLENVVFLGDSITEGYDLNKYYESLPHINSGVSGYCTEDILENLESFVYQYNPTKVIILIGTNDIGLNDSSSKAIANNIKKIIDGIKKNRSKAKIYVQSIYPINKESKEEKINLDMIKIRENDKIKETNKQIEKICKEKKVVYIDVYDVLLDEDGNLDIDYTRDGLHMSEEGYEVVTKKIKEVLEIE